MSEAVAAGESGCWRQVVGQWCLAGWEAEPVATGSMWGPAQSPRRAQELRPQTAWRSATLGTLSRGVRAQLRTDPRLCARVG